MNKNLDKDYQNDQNQFFQKLKEFHQLRGTHLGRIPSFGGQVLDLHALYNIVTSFGGISIVTERKKWDQVFVALGFPPCTNAAFALRQHYCKYLEAYEKIYFFGEEADEVSSESSRMGFSKVSRYQRMNRLPLITSVGEPLVQNFNRIMFSLQSGFPNEVDFALNICSLLSNVQNSIFNLAKCPQILSLILGHVGVWCQDDSFVDHLCEDWHTQRSNYHKFWIDAIDDKTALKVYKNCSLGLLHQDDVDQTSSKFFATFSKKRFERNKTPEITRISQVLTILYNFSFETINGMFMSGHDATKRFLLFAGCCQESFIKRTALDTLDNIADYLIIGRREDPFNQNFLQVLHGFFSSNNKLKRLRGQSILAKLASSEENKDILVDLLSDDVYKQLIETLYLPDISLLLHALDTLYYLSGLSRETADAVVGIHGSISVLISLSTIRAESFGNRAIEGYRIIENKLSIFSPKNQQWLKHQQQQQHHQQQQLQQQQLQHMNQQRYIMQPPHHNPHPRPPMNYPPVGVAPEPQLPRHPPVGALGVPQFAPRPPPTPHPQKLPPVQSQRNIEPLKDVTIQSHPAQRHQQKAPSENDLVELENDVFTAHWMSGFYEPHTSNHLSSSFLYQDYTTTCAALKRGDVLSKEDFFAAIRAILPPDLVRFQALKEDIILHGIQRRKVPMQVHSRIPRVIYQQLVATGQLKPKTHPTPSTPKLSKQINQQPSTPQMPTSEMPLLSTPVPGALPNSGNSLNLKNADECRATLEKMKQEIQTHFMNFHAQRQYIQSIQAEASKKQLPANMMKDVEIRVQGHYQQMQFHFQKLQQLNVISEEVNQKLKSFEEPGFKHHPAGTPNKRVKNGQEITVPPPAPLYQHVNIQHNVPVNSIDPELMNDHHGKTKRKKTQNSKSNDQSPRGTPQSPGTPNSVTLKNPFGQFPHAEALKTLYRNHLKARDQNSLDNNLFPVVDTMAAQNSPRLDTSDTPNVVNTTAKENVDATPSPKNHSFQVGILTNGDGLPNGILTMNGDHHDPKDEKLIGDGECKQNGTALDHLQKTVNDIEDYKNPPSPLCNGDKKTNSISTSSSFPSASTSSSSPKKRKLVEKEELSDTKKDKDTPRDGEGGDRTVNGNNAEEKIKGKCDMETDVTAVNQIIDDKHDEISQNGQDESALDEDHQNGEREIDRVKSTDIPSVGITETEVLQKKKSKAVSSSENQQQQQQQQHIENGSTREESKIPADEKEIAIAEDDAAPKTLEAVKSDNTVNQKDLSLNIIAQQQQPVEQSSTPVQQNISSTSSANPGLLSFNMNQMKPNNTTLSDCSSGNGGGGGESVTTPREAESRPKVNAPELNIQGNGSYWQLNGKHKISDVFSCRWDRCNSQPFVTSRDLLDHMVDAHAPPLEGKMSRCKVKGCSTSHKPRGILICHFRDNHCQCTSTDEINKSKDFRMEDESPVTRSIRYTSTLILRNLIRSATRGEEVLSSYESHLASIAMSSSEATLAAVDGLFELNLLTNKKITSDEEDDGEDEDDNNSEIIELEHQGAGSIEEEMSTTKQFSQPTTSAIVVS